MNDESLKLPDDMELRTLAANGPMIITDPAIPTLLSQRGWECSACLQVLPAEVPFHTRSMCPAAVLPDDVAGTTEEDA